MRSHIVLSGERPPADAQVNRKNAFSRFATKRLRRMGYGKPFPQERPGPSRTDGDRGLPQAVPVATREAAGSDGRDEGFPFSLKQAAHSISSY